MSSFEKIDVHEHPIFTHTHMHVHTFCVSPCGNGRVLSFESVSVKQTKHKDESVIYRKDIKLQGFFVVNLFF